MAKDIKIRKFDREEVNLLYKMIQATIDISYCKVYTAEAVDYFKECHSIGEILNDAKHGYAVVAEYNGEILGTGTLLGSNVRRVYVDSAHQRDGIGKQIVADIERRSKGLYLDLAASLVSLPFWESCGYQIQREAFIPVRNDQKLRYYKMAKKI